jgi:hypothetical protein
MGKMKSSLEALLAASGFHEVGGVVELKRK